MYQRWYTKHQGPIMPDAYLLPHHLPRCKPGEDRHVKIKELFAKGLGSKLAWVHPVQLGAGLRLDLIRPSPDAPPYYFPKNHPWAGRDRYEWRDAPEFGEGVKAGTLVSDEELYAPERVGTAESGLRGGDAGQAGGRAGVAPAEAASAAGPGQ